MARRIFSRNMIHQNSKCFAHSAALGRKCRFTDPLGPLGGSLGPLGGLLGALGGSFCHLLGSLWGLLGTLGEIFGATWGVLGTFWGPSGCQKVPQGLPRGAQVTTKTVAERVVSPTGFPMQFKAYFPRVFESRAQAWECAKCTKMCKKKKTWFYSILSRSPLPRAKQSSHKRKN